jgi:hypothetical protein
MPLSSRTSGVDGSSEGGRINTELLTNNLALFGTALAEELRARGHAGKVTIRPDLRDGIPVLVATFAGDPPAGVPAHWAGRRVIVEKEPPPAPPSPPPAPPAP